MEPTGAVHCPSCEKQMWNDLMGPGDAHCECGMLLKGGQFYAPPSVVQRIRDEAKVSAYNDVLDLLRCSIGDLESGYPGGFFSDTIIAKMDELEIVRLKVQGLLKILGETP